jgi:hypothetical protein
MVVNPKLARILFALALAMYLLWFAALVTLGVMSGDRPAEGRTRSVTVPLSPSPDLLQPKD